MKTRYVSLMKICISDPVARGLFSRPYYGHDSCIYSYIHTTELTGCDPCVQSLKFLPFDPIRKKFVGSCSRQSDIHNASRWVVFIQQAARHVWSSSGGVSCHFLAYFGFNVVWQCLAHRYIFWAFTVLIFLFKNKYMIPLFLKMDHHKIRA